MKEYIPAAITYHRWISTFTPSKLDIAIVRSRIDAYMRFLYHSPMHFYHFDLHNSNILVQPTIDPHTMPIHIIDFGLASFIAPMEDLCYIPPLLESRKFRNEKICFTNGVMLVPSPYVLSMQANYMPHMGNTGPKCSEETLARFSPCSSDTDSSSVSSSSPTSASSNYSSDLYP